MNFFFTDDPDAEYLYRYDYRVYGCGVDQFDEPIRGCNHVKLQVTKYKVLKRTPKGAWIDYFNVNGNNEKFVRLTAKKQFACNTKEEALESFLFRKKRQLSILTSQIANVKTAINIANNMKDPAKKSPFLT